MLMTTAPPPKVSKAPTNPKTGEVEELKKNQEWTVQTAPLKAAATPHQSLRQTEENQVLPHVVSQGPPNNHAHAKMSTKYKAPASPPKTHAPSDAETTNDTKQSQDC